MTESVNQRHQPISKSVIQQTERKKGERKKEKKERKQQK